MAPPTNAPWADTFRAVSFLAPFAASGTPAIGTENGARAIEDYLGTDAVCITTGAAVGNPLRPPLTGDPCARRG